LLLFSSGTLLGNGEIFSDRFALENTVQSQASYNIFEDARLLTDTPSRPACRNGSAGRSRRVEETEGSIYIDAS